MPYADRSDVGQPDLEVRIGLRLSFAVNGRNEFGSEARDSF